VRIVKNSMGWNYHEGYKWWEGAHGYGKFAVQKTRIGWLLYSVPSFGNPDVLGQYESKELAMRKAEELSHL